MSKPCSALKDELPFTVMDKLWPLIPDPFHILDQHVKRRIILRDFCFIILRTQARKQFMTDDPTEAEEMRERWLAFDCVAEVAVLDEPDWVGL